MGKTGSELADLPSKTLIVIPKMDDSGPSKGAVALLNGLLREGYNAELLPLRAVANRPPIQGQNNFLTATPRLLQKARALRVYACEHGQRVSVVSMCFSADVTVYLSGLARQGIASIRANLVKNYWMDYGAKGLVLAFLHYAIASRFELMAALNTSMALTLNKFSRRVVVIPNFIDEVEIERGLPGGGPVRFIFVGSLSTRKAIIELIEAFGTLKSRGFQFVLDVLGDGPLRTQVSDKIISLGLSGEVILHGQVKDTLAFYANADYFLLPSYSEGTSRAAMEALYVGLPCIMRDVDSNAELISGARQGSLFKTADELAACLAEAIASPKPSKNNRLPEQFRQVTCVSAFLGHFAQIEK